MRIYIYMRIYMHIYIYIYIYIYGVPADNCELPVL